MSVCYWSENRENKLAYIQTSATERGGDLPAVLFLGGFKSDMSGTKAGYLEEQCRLRGQEFVRFDYSGHGVSDGAFVDGTIGLWKRDALDILDHIVTAHDVVLVGSSMGGWISLLLLLERPERVNGVVGVAAAPDFTRDIESQLTETQRLSIESDGYVEEANEYSDDPYIFTRSLLEDGRAQSLLHKEYTVDAPITLIQGKVDNSVPWDKALRIQKCFGLTNTNVVFVDDGDHSLSRSQDLALIDSQLCILLKGAE